jgi:hypothetical protein
MFNVDGLIVYVANIYKVKPDSIKKQQNKLLNNKMRQRDHCQLLDIKPALMLERALPA